MANILTVTCASCGAEESMDSVLMRIVDDDAARNLVRDLLCAHFSVGGLVLRYLRLFKPPKHKLGMPKVRAVLAELVPDVQRGYIERKGRVWQVGQPQWVNALNAVFAAVDKGTLKTPLPGNAYLYEVLMRQADACEAQAEAKTEQDRRNTPQRGSLQIDGGPASIGGLVGKDPALAAIDERTRNASKPDPATAARIASILGKAK